MDHSVLQEIVILLCVSVLAVLAFRRLNMPPILAYLFVGVLVGPYGWGWIPNDESTRFLAEFGVVFLLFTVGLEFSLPRFLAMRRDVLGLGGAQVILTTAIIAAVALVFDLKAETAFIIGGTLALSSTAIVIKQLTEQLEMNSRHARLSLGILLFQDLAVVPFLILIPALSGESNASLGWELGMAFLKAAVVLGGMLALGHWFLRPLFRSIAKQRSPELFTLSVLLFSLAAAWVTHASGLSLALGAFLAGMMLSETEFRHQVETDIRPFRDVLLGLFFVTIGMLLDIGTLPGILHWVLLVVAGMMLLKFLLIAAVSRLSGAETGVAVRAGISLAQGGEFGFAILALALSANLLPERASQIVLAAIVISMALAPSLIRYNGAIAKKLCKSSYGTARQKIESEVFKRSENLKDHVIICGFGRIGQNVARFLERESIPYIALDLDPVRIREAKQAGQPVIYGDSTHMDILNAANLARARVLVISYDDYSGANKILSQVREQHTQLPILVRTRDDSHLDQLQKAGATEVVPETLEASLMLSSHLLMLLGVPLRKVVENVQAARESRYQILREFFHGQEAVGFTEPDAVREGLHSVTLDEGAWAVGHTLGELKLDATGVNITSIRRGDSFIDEPDSALTLEVDDVIVMYGTPENLDHAEAELISGMFLE